MKKHIPTIYVADDNPVLLQGIQRALAVSGYRVDTADTGAVLLEHLEAAAEPPDVVIMDVMMPELSGLEVLARIRSNPRWAQIPVILITAATEKLSAVHPAGTDGFDFLAKPFRLADLVARIEAHLERAGEPRRRHTDLPDVRDELPDRDGLTGCASRPAALAHLVGELDLARRTRRSLAVVLLDVDHFGTINDLHGSPVGEAVLRACGEWLCNEETLRAGVRVGRYGSDEFVVVIPGGDREGAVRVAESARDHLASLALHSPAGRVGASLSVGIAVWPTVDAGSAEQLLECAAAALQEAKQAGRNCIRLASLNGRLIVQSPQRAP